MLLDDIATYLAAQSTAFTVLSGTGGNVAKAVMLDATPAPATMIALYETPGVAPDHSFSTSGAARVWERPNLQVLSRSTSYQTARNNADTVFTILDGLAATLPTATGTVYQSISALQSPFFLQRDENSRVIVACNYAVRKSTG